MKFYCKQCKEDRNGIRSYPNTLHNYTLLICGTCHYKKKENETSLIEFVKVFSGASTKKLAPHLYERWN